MPTPQLETTIVMRRNWNVLLPLTALSLGLCLGACKKPEVQESAGEPEVAAATPIPATPKATPPPVAVATPEPNYFAPPGVYYLVTPASVETSDGIVGLKPGARLQKTGPGKYTTDGHTVELTDRQVTNDLRIAQQIAGADQAAQIALRQAMRAAEAAAATRTVNSVAPSATPNTVVARGQSNAPAPARPASSLGSSGTFNRTKSQDGYIWEMDANGNWQPIRPNR